MLLDMLGALIGFATVMLLLALLVTSMVELTQDLVAIRARNLQAGLAELLAQKGLTVGAADVTARTVLEARGARGATRQGKFFRWFEPRVTAISFPEATALLAKVLPAGGPEAETAPAITEAEFRRMEDNLSARYRRLIRSVSIAWALLVAVLFQVNAIALLERLSSDAALRQRADEAAAQLIADPRVRSAARDPRAAVNVAIERLGERHPELARPLEQVSGLAVDRETMRAELRFVLEDQRADVAAIAEEYDSILAGLERPGEPSQAVKTGEIREKLAALDLTPWREGPAFYFEQSAPRPANWLGVLITTVLLTLGAPFWYERLRGLAGLRDIFAERSKAAEGKAPD